MSESPVYKLSTIERETIIIYNEAEPMATVFTCNKALTKKLKQMALEREDTTLIKEDIYGGEFVLPKRFVAINKPRVMTDEQMKDAVERGKRLASMRRDLP